MRKRNPSFFKRLFFSKIFILFCLIIIVLISYSLSKKVLQKRQINNEIRTLGEEIAQLEKNNQELTEMIGYIKSVSFAEKEARLKMGLSKPDESVVIIADVGGEKAGENNQVPKDDASVSQDKFSNPRLWWNYFFGRL